MTSGYADFLRQKVRSDPETGISDVPDLNRRLFEFQHDIDAWALRRGRAAIFADCGLGKGPMGLEWARVVESHTKRPVMFLAPLGVAPQIVREAQKFGIDGVEYCRDGASKAPIVVTNYEMLRHFDVNRFGGVVLDESSLLKNYAGALRTEMTQAFAQTPFRLCQSATPAPNDHMELGTHAEFLGVMSRTEMLATFFTHDGGDTSKWRLKGHAEQSFWKWLCSWAVMVRSPSDLGYDDGAFVLPELLVHEISVRVDRPTSGMLFAVEAQTLQERQAARRETIAERVADCASIVNGTTEPFVVWCDLNAESAALAKAIPDAVEVTGSDSPEFKERAMLDFSEGRRRVLVSKPSICGMGMNWQHCHNTAFVGLSESWESYYQAVRRFYRFGQTKPVNVYIITAETEGAVVANIKRKERQAREMAENMAIHMRDAMRQQIRSVVRETTTYEPSAQILIPNFLRKSA